MCPLFVVSCLLSALVGDDTTAGSEQLRPHVDGP